MRVRQEDVMPFFPTIDLTPQVKMLLARGALTLNPGQWVRGEKGRGRFLRTDPRTGTAHVSWLRPGDDWKTASQRFHRACRKGYIGKYRGLYEFDKTNCTTAIPPLRWKVRAPVQMPLFGYRAKDAAHA
ncbi:hypothetical protein TSH64_17840 [Azospirillum sp. TSH64]|nr:hypothetical protein TSH64_17840 [Azospirillum sp. TSH64]